MSNETDIETVEVTNELGGTRRLNKNVKLLVLAGLGLIILIIMYGFSQLDSGVKEAAIAEEKERIAEPASRPTLEIDTTNGIIPAQRPVPQPRELAKGGTVPVIIPDASGNIGQEHLAGPSEEETAQMAEHKSALLQIILDDELDRKAYALERNRNAGRRTDTTYQVAAESSMSIESALGKSDNLLNRGGGIGGLASAGTSASLQNALGGVSLNNPIGGAVASSGGGGSAADAQLELLKALSGNQSSNQGGASFSPFGDDNDPNNQGGKQDFLDTEKADADYLNNVIQEPVSPYELKQGTIIPGVMVTGINSDLPGSIIGQVSQNVYDTSSGAHLLIPQGTRVFGRYDSAVSYGQNRALVVWNRLIYPNGKAINIANMAGADGTGASGLKDKTNRHLFGLYSQAVLLSAIGGGIDALTDTISNDQLVDPVTGQVIQQTRQQRQEQAIRQEFGDNLGAVTAKVLDRGLDRQPTLKIRAGKPFVILVDQDIILEPYK